MALRHLSLVLLAAGALALAGCGGSAGGIDNESYPDSINKGNPTGKASDQNSIFGPGGLLGSSKPKTEGGGGIGVNSFLWRASLDTVAFMPLASADPFGGVIITDWYSPPATPSERFKLNIFILDRTLRADGIKVTVFRQVRGGADSWSDDAATPDMASNVEDAILTRARQLRIDAATGS
jgi:hypothetical protein